MTDTLQRKLIIAIDGPAGAGKSTIAARLARKLGYVNLESGAMYRALALKAIDKDASFDDEVALVKLADTSLIQLEPTISGNRTLLDGKDVSARIRERDVTEGASRISVHPKVREWMVSHQRAMGAGGGVVMEGRDIGTKVFPDADLKVFLDADPVIREQRRMAQQKISGDVAANVAADLRERDRRDRTRAASPLVAADDAVVIDSTSMSEDHVLARVEELVKEKLGFKVSKFQGFKVSKWSLRLWSFETLKRSKPVFLSRCRSPFDCAQGSWDSRGGCPYVSFLVFRWFDLLFR
jgi:cytidylate kinase